MDNIRNLLNEVNTKIKALETAKELYGEQLAPDFSVFDFINTNETGISWILANLLNPKSTHGQKTLFLEKFIKICLPNIDNHEDKRWQNYLTNLSNTTVITEQTTTASQTNRRMDIYLSAKISDETFGICIENKPYAGDQPDQLTDYYNELKNRNLTCKHLVYLSEYGEPSDYSVKAELLDIWRNEKIFSHVTYTMLVDWLTECKKDCQNQSVTEFINQFIKFIQKQFMGMEDMNEQTEILEIMQSNSQNISSAISISSSIDVMKKNLMNEFISQLKLKSQNKSYHVETQGIFPKNRYQNIQFKLNGLTDFDIRIQFEDTNYSTFFIGISTLNESQINSEKYHKIAKAIKNNQHQLPKNVILEGNVWCIWYDLEPTHWDNNPKVWAEIPKGTLSESIIKEVDKLYEILKDNHLLD